jgi:hypothetical protein
MTSSQPVVQFLRLIEQAQLPRRADRSAGGTLPTRAYRYCEAVTSATGFGWWVFAPMDMQLIWDGQDVFWHFAGAPDWLPLTGAVQFPDFSAAFDQAAPEDLQGCAPPFLTALPEPGMVQIWTGLMARTAADWSLLIRSPANMAMPGGYSLFEGIVETDQWFGPLFTNLRLTRTHKPVHIRADFPLLQVQPLPRHVYDDATLGSAAIIPDMTAMQRADWDAYYSNIVVPGEDPDRAFGRYAAGVRKRRRGGCPFSQSKVEAATV